MERILGVGGSPRKNGNTDMILRHILAGAKSRGANTDKARLCDHRYEPCIGCERCRKTNKCLAFQDGMQLLYPIIRESRGLVLVTPVHNYNLTAWMKAFIDRLYCFYNFDMNSRPGDWSSTLANQGRKAIIAAVAEQNDKRDMGVTFEAMRMPLEALGYEIIDELPVLGVFAAGAVAEYADVLTACEDVGGQLAEALQEAS
jgi:multimeric flavodoxin WrbA